MTSKELSKPTKGQLERTLAQQIQRLYRDELGHSTGKITCQLRDGQLTIVVESSLTQPEQRLLEEFDSERVEKLHSDLNELVRSKLFDLVENVLDRKVVDMMSDTTLKTERTGFVIVLSDSPCTRDSDKKNINIVQAS